MDGALMHDREEMCMHGFGGGKLKNETTFKTEA
jgi:hypothetical protein